MHEREDTKDAYTETIRRAAGSSLYNGDELVAPRQDFRRGQARNADRALLGNSGEGCETKATTRQTTNEENRRLASAILNPRLWSFVEYGSRSSLPAIAGVYCVLTGEDVLLYIGQSTNICQRWRGHHLRQQLRAGKSLRIAWRETFSEAGRLKMEALLVRQYQPRLNVNLLPRREAAPSVVSNMKLLSTNEAAERLGVSARRVLAMIDEGKIAAHRLGRDYAIEESALEGVTIYGKAGRPPNASPANEKRATAKPRVKAGASSKRGGKK